MKDSLSNKLVDVVLEESSFVPQDSVSGEPVAYWAVFLKFVINGNVEQMRFKVTRDQALVLKGLPNVDNEILELYKSNEGGKGK